MKRLEEGFHELSMRTIEANSLVHRPSFDPMLFIVRPRSQAAGAKWTHEHFDCEPTRLSTVPPHFDYRLRTPDFPKYASYPEHLVIRTDVVLSPAIQASILKLFDHLVACGAVPHLVANDNRSSSPAFHLALWEKFMRTPALTKDTTDQNPAASQAIWALCGVLKGSVAPLWVNILKRYTPRTWKIQYRAYKRIKRELGDAFPEWMDFGGAFFTFAVKEGGSELCHIDWGDSPFTLTMVVSVGDKTVYICVPQLRIKIPLCAGQLLGLASRLLSHFVWCVVDEYGADARRVVIVGFCDELAVSHSFKPSLRRRRR